MVMAVIYIKCERFDKAVDELKYLMSLKSGYTANTLKASRWLEPLRDMPQFQELIAKYDTNL